MTRDRTVAAAVVVALYVGGGGMAKLAGIPYFHGSFAELGLPGWFGYFIGACEVLGAVALFVRPLRRTAALGLLVIMLGATWYHLVHTPPLLAMPAIVMGSLCGYVAWPSPRSPGRRAITPGSRPGLRHGRRGVPPHKDPG